MKPLSTTPVKPPWICPKHPTAQIRHSWDQTHYVMNGYPVGEGMQGRHRYECAECGTELAAPFPRDAA